MSELPHIGEYSAENEAELAKKITDLVKWLAWVENDHQYWGDARRLGYYTFQQDGPLLHGDVYFGIHSVEESPDDYVMELLAPDLATDRSGFVGRPLVSISALRGKVYINEDESYSETPRYVEAVVDHYIDWLSKTPLAHSPRQDRI